MVKSIHTTIPVKLTIRELLDHLEDILGGKLLSTLPTLHMQIARGEYESIVDAHIALPIIHA